MVGDVDNVTKKRDEEDWVPWTSVAKSGPDTISVNQRTKLGFPKGTPYWQYEIIMAGENGQPYSSPFLALASVEPYSPWAEETPLTIRGKPGSPDIRYATVLVRMNDDTHQVIWKMKVMVLPPAPVKSLRFYEVPSSSAEDDQIPQVFSPGKTAGQGIASPLMIKDEINQRFASAAVRADVPADAVDWIRVNNYPWERGRFPKTYIFTDDQEESFPDPGCIYGNINGLLTGHCNFFLFPYLQALKEGANTNAEWLGDPILPNSNKIVVVGAWNFQKRAQKWPATDPNGWSRQDPEIGTEGTMQRTLAHEFGHFLSLATREWKPNKKQGGHDDLSAVNSYPIGANDTKYPPLMKSVSPVGVWLRHEDWRAANERATGVEQ